MVKTNKDSLSISSSGVWLLLFLGVALFLLLPTVIMADSDPRNCFADKGFDPHCRSDEEYCVKRWRLDEKADVHGSYIGCSSKKKFFEDYGFNPFEGGCGGSRKKKGEFICACSYYEKYQLCNDYEFGEGEAKKWKARGGSSRLFPSVPLAALLILTVAILGC